jgi:hypothetical protein
MAQYDVFVFCKVCAGVHEVGTTVTLTDGPVERQSIGHAYTYEGKCIPPKLGFLTPHPYHLHEERHFVCSRRPESNVLGARRMNLTRTAVEQSEVV